MSLGKIILNSLLQNTFSHSGKDGFILFGFILEAIFQNTTSSLVIFLNKSQTETANAGVEISLKAVYTSEYNSQKPITHSLLKSTVAQPSMKPGSLVNHRTTRVTNTISTATSAKQMLPSFRYSCFITLYASLSRSVLMPQPNDFLMLHRSMRPHVGKSWQEIMAHCVTSCLFLDVLMPIKMVQNGPTVLTTTILLST